MHTTRVYNTGLFCYRVVLCIVCCVLRLVCGVVWCSVVWCGVVWCGVVWCGVVWCGVMRGICDMPIVIRLYFIVAICITAHSLNFKTFKNL